MGKGWDLVEYYSVLVSFALAGATGFSRLMIQAERMNEINFSCRIDKHGLE